MLLQGHKKSNTGPLAKTSEILQTPAITNKSRQDVKEAFYLDR
jgi:hypothetical protein